MLHIKEVIVVEGKYDKEVLKKITDAPIVCTGGFSLYKNPALKSYLKKEAEKNGIIILTDSDSAGFRIRNYIKQCIGEKGKIINAYVPTVLGKEKRKAAPGKEGILGVEGFDKTVLENVLKKSAVQLEKGNEKKPFIGKSEFFSLGLSGGEESAELRKKQAKKLGLPLRISANAMIDIINKTVSEKDFFDAVEKINQTK